MKQTFWNTNSGGIFISLLPRFLNGIKL